MQVKVLDCIIRRGNCTETKPSGVIGCWALTYVCLPPRVHKHRGIMRILPTCERSEEAEWRWEGTRCTYCRNNFFVWILTMVLEQVTCCGDYLTQLEWDHHTWLLQVILKTARVNNYACTGLIKFHNKIPQVGGCNNRNLFPYLLEVWGPRSGYGQNQIFWKVSHLGCWVGTFPWPYMVSPCAQSWIVLCSYIFFPMMLC